MAQVQGRREVETGDEEASLEEKNSWRENGGQKHMLAYKADIVSLAAQLSVAHG